MSLVWSATSTESGRFSPVGNRSEVTDLYARLSDLRSRGQGYIEVRSSNRDFPVLTMAFRDDHAVVHLESAPERMSLLAGGDTLPSDAEVEVPIMDELAVFTGDFVLQVDRAWDVVNDFSRTGVVGAPGEWREL